MSSINRENILENRTVHTKREYNLEMLKAIAIMAMVFCHPVIRLGVHIPGHEQSFLFWLGEDFFGYYLAVAHAFMLAMGFGFNYTRRGAPSDYIFRGVKMYLLWLLVNFLRYGMYMIGEGIFTGEFRDDIWYALLAADIYQFVGLALILTGILKYLGLKDTHILLVGIVMSMIGSFAAFTDTGSFFGNVVLGHFIVTDFETSAFPLLNWYVVVGVGMVFGRWVKNTDAKDRLYKHVLAVSSVVLAAYIVLSCIFGEFFMSARNNFYASSTPEIACLLSIDFFLLSIFYFILKKADISKLGIFMEMSRNVTLIYIIHWALIGFVDCVFYYVFEIQFSFLGIYLIAVLILVVSFFVARWIARRSRL